MQFYFAIRKIAERLTLKGKDVLGKLKRGRLKSSVSLSAEIEVVKKDNNGETVTIYGPTEISSEGQLSKVEETTSCLIQYEADEIPERIENSEKENDEHRKRIARLYYDWRESEGDLADNIPEWLRSVDEINDFVLYQHEATRLYHEFMELWIKEGGHCPDESPELITPGHLRPYYETFKFLAKLTDTEETILKCLGSA